MEEASGKETRTLEDASRRGEGKAEPSLLGRRRSNASHWTTPHCGVVWCGVAPHHTTPWFGVVWFCKALNSVGCIGPVYTLDSYTFDIRRNSRWHTGIQGGSCAWWPGGGCRQGHTCNHKHLQGVHMIAFTRCMYTPCIHLDECTIRIYTRVYALAVNEHTCLKLYMRACSTYVHYTESQRKKEPQISGLRLLNLLLLCPQALNFLPSKRPKFLNIPAKMMLSRR